MGPLRHCHRKLCHCNGAVTFKRLPNTLCPVFEALTACFYGSILASTRIPLADLHNCTLFSEFSSSPDLSLKRSFRPISSSNLHALPRSQRCPIYLLVFQGSIRNLSLVVSFTLRCFQRLSRPYFASQLCPWQDNCCTSGTSIPVLSY